MADTRHSRLIVPVQTIGSALVEGVTTVTTTVSHLARNRDHIGRHSR